MREILFKAKRIDNGEWVEGELVRRKSYGTDDVIEAHIIIDAYEQSNFRNFGWQPVLISPLAIDKYDEGCYRVNPGTICQYTGLTDKNGSKIWEGDVVKCNYNNYGEKGAYVGKVIFREDNCIFVVTNGKSTDYEWWNEEKEVIGNIFDNKELLEN